MNLTAPAPSTQTPPTQHTYVEQHRGYPVNNRSENLVVVDFQQNAREELASLLWQAFPEESENAVSKAAAPVLGKTDRQIRKYLRLLVAEPPGWMKYALKSIIAARKLGARIEHGHFPHNRPVSSDHFRRPG